MTYLFDPSVLEKLSLDSIINGKDVTTNPDDKSHQYQLRPLKSSDYDYLRLLKQLTEVGDVSENDFDKRFNEFVARPRTYFIIVLEDLVSKKMVGCATLVVELKIIHKCSKRGHIEDVVVDEDCRKQGFGKLLIGTLIKVGEAEGCYKISLDCNQDKAIFYERNGFKQETISMCVRLSH
ncbi:unnamed protein product [Hymenolepis diminuta]|uniref:Glucosamine 6-phosphate N-acetyltransferase n=1 Tax=Hymenolepis diminuta TaxID=6216 RepID=A0A0R3SGJ1_HYMDI|nr:unnamed protein product [Hymenolepis diminuta]VUZ57332.1 unnamed protein product [Hymenolepis diminuta]